MRTSALELLACPRCGGSLIADSQRSAPDGHLMAGTLRCTCGARYPIEGGVPRLFPSDAAERVPSPGGRLAEEWHIFDAGAAHAEQRFLDVVAPLAPRDFTDRTVLELGCGRGQHTRLVARYGAREVVAVDHGESADAAFAALRHLPRVHVVDGDVTAPPVLRAFDIGLSLGILHYLPVPVTGFRALRDRVVIGGQVVVWVYGYESNQWLARVVDPMRRHLTSRLSTGAAYWMTLPPALVLAMVVRACRLRSVARRMPYGELFHYISDYPLREIHGLVFEQLRVPVDSYVDENTFRSWFDNPHLADAQVEWHMRSSWRAVATVTGHAEDRAAPRPRRHGS